MVLSGKKGECPLHFFWQAPGFLGSILKIAVFLLLTSIPLSIFILVSLGKTLALFALLLWFLGFFFKIIAGKSKG